MADLNKIIDDLSSLTVVEAAELSKQLEKKWGVTAATAVAAPATASDTAPEEEKSEFTIMLAEAEVDKWSLERLRAKRLASEKEQLEILNSRKAEATRLTYELEDIITSAKDEIDRLVEGNQKMKILIENSEKTETMAEELITKLSVTQNELKEAQGQIQDLSDRNDTLDIKLQDAKIEIENILKINLVIIIYPKVQTVTQEKKQKMHKKRMKLLDLLTY